jgi:hypothetical protein
MAVREHLKLQVPNATAPDRDRHQFDCHPLSLKVCSIGRKELIAAN